MPLAPYPPLDLARRGFAIESEMTGKLLASKEGMEAL